MTGGEKFEAVLINNPEYMGMLSEEITNFANKLNIEGVTSQSLWKHFYQSIQRFSVQIYAGVIPTQELWTVLNKEGKAIAFAHWQVLDAPYNGTVYCDFVYSWNTAKIPTNMLADKFIEFGKKHGCVWYRGTAINNRVFNVFTKILEGKKLKIIKDDAVNFVGRR